MSDDLVFTNPVVGDGKVTIPKHIRRALNIKVGDLVELKIIRVFENDLRQKYPPKEGGEK